MKHLSTPDFWALFELLPPDIQVLARKNFDLLKENPMHPSLHLKRIRQYRSVRIGLHYRALGIDVTEGILWFWIGTHADYDKIVG